MGLVYHLSRAKLRAKLLRRLGSAWTNAYLTLNLRPTDEVVLRPDGSLEIPSIGLVLPKPDPQTHLALSCVETLGLLHRKTPICVRLHKQGIMVEVDGLSCYAEAPSDIVILHEIFGERLYEFRLPGPHLVLDFGMNLGYASLFFLNEYEAEVWGYELVPSTAALATENLLPFRERCKVHLFGLAAKNGEFDVTVDPKGRSGAGIENRYGGSHQERAQVRDVAEVFREVREARAGRRLVVKLDVEGAEYEVFDRLAETEQLREMDLLMMEWHGTNPDPILGHLEKAGFAYTNRRHPSEALGFITAWPII